MYIIFISLFAFLQLPKLDDKVIKMQLTVISANDGQMRGDLI